MNRDAEREEYREVRQLSLAGGVNTSTNETLLAPDESPSALNVDFDRNAVQATGGSIKFNNQVAPGSAVRCRVDPSLSPLMVLPTPLGGAGNALLGTVDVPLRGYEYFPYSADTDIGGTFDSEGDFLTGAEVFHIRRGRSFEINASFMLPPEEKLYEANTKGALAPATPTTVGNPAFDPGNGFDEALDECVCIIQKGGDRTAPMSWALAIVNVGNGYNLAQLPAIRPSNYALVFMWYDAPQWGEAVPSTMKYNLSTGQAVIGGAGSQYSTQAYRAVLIHKYIEPGRRYSVAVQLAMDSGSPGATTPTPANTAWNADGTFKVWISEDAGTATSYTYVDSTAVATGLEVVRGPLDSLSYISRYGIRYAGRDALFGGLGMRFAPWMKCGFLPFGADCTPLKSGGFSMVDRSAITTADLYGAAVYTLTFSHVPGDAYFVAAFLGLSVGNVANGYDPKARPTGAATYIEWQGLQNYPNCNTNALRGYRIVATNDWGVTQRGGVATMLDYLESGGAARINILDGANAAKFGNWAPFRGLVQCFRWHQRDLIVGQIRVWSAPRAYDAADAILSSRRKLSLHSSVRLDDATEPDIGTLRAYWPCDDAEAATLHELVVGGSRNGFLCPFGNATTDGGQRGAGQVFLSGEGEALVLDLSDDPIFQREVAKMLAGSSQGFGFELTTVQTEAFYPIGQWEALPDATALTGMRPRMVPDLVCWDIKDATNAGTRARARPLLCLSTRNLLSSIDPRPLTRPAGFSVAVAHRSDQENVDTIVPSDLLPWYRDSAAATHFRFDPTAPWVGRTVTIQVGIQSTGVADQYDVYVAMTPKDAFLPANGDPSDAEFAYWTDGAVGALGTPYENNTYFTAAHLTVRRKDLVRSVLTVGGRWDCLGKPGDTSNLGYGELNARMLVDEVRWFLTSPAGALPALSGGILASRNGKLEGTNCLPPRELVATDMLEPLGEGVRSANVTQGSSSVTPPSQTALYSAEPRSSEKAVKGAYLAVSGDEVAIPKPETFGLTKPEWYGVSSVATGGASMTLRSAYVDPTRMGTVAGVFRLAGYSSFGDDVRDKPLTLGRGKSYSATGITVADVILTDALWPNGAYPGGDWKLRIYSPLGRSSSAEILPSWARGLVTERRGPGDGILGLYGFNSKVYAGVRGALHEADDRWREDGPSDLIPRSLCFRAAQLPGGITAGLHDDRVEFNIASNAKLVWSTTDAYIICVDVWGCVDSFDEYQTILWVGDPTSDPSLNASATGHKIQYCARLNRGRPELVLGSTSAYTGATGPEKGLYVATAQQAVAPGEWFFARFYLKTRLGGTVLLKPYCKVNGKSSAVRVNATDVGVAGTNDWLLTANIVAPSNALTRALLGIGRDSYKAADANLTFSSSTIQGTLVKPQRISGYLHSFNGKLASVVVSQQPPWTGTEPPDFDPFVVGYTGSGGLIMFQVLGHDSLGIGHKLFESSGAIYGAIRSHPFVSVFHEFGRSSDPIAWAEFGSQLYAANGGKPAVIIDGVGMAAGVQAPTTEPSFTLDRFPIWKPNVRGTGQDDTYDPILAALTSATKPNYHYNTVGNTYLRSVLDTSTTTLMSWVRDGYFHLKGYVRPRSVAGRIQLWRKSDASQGGGPFLDIVDGKARFGWYDIDLKTEVYVETTGIVFEPNCVHYVNIRKRWPIDDALEVNWQNSYFTDGRVRRITINSAGTFPAGTIITDGGAKRGLVTKYNGGTTMEYVALVGAFIIGDLVGGGHTVATAPVRPMNDVFAVRRFRRSGEGLVSMMAVVGVSPLRNRVSFTSNTLAAPAGTSATGLVSAPGAIYSGAAAGVVNTSATAPAMGNLFSLDMKGMYWVWGTGATDAAGSVAGKKYRITAINSATQLVVQDEELGTTPNFASTTDKPGGVFTGVELHFSTGFAASKSPDTSQGTIELMGSSIQGQSTAPFAAFDGEFYSMGWGITAGSASGTDARCFESLDSSIAGAAGTDPITIGSDEFAAENYDGAAGEPGALRYDDSRQVWCVDGRNYGAVFGANTSQPNTALVVAKDPHSPSVAPLATGSANPVFAYIQLPEEWSAQRVIAVAFFDKTQNIVGNPSPFVTVKATAEDITNPSGAVRIRITNLPVARVPSEVWIFESVANGDVGALFRVAQVENGTSEAAIQFTDEETSTGLVLDSTNDQPPRCEIVETSGSRLVFGALEVQPDGCVASKPGFPGQVDFSKVFRLNSGFGDRVTGLKDLDGALVASKRRAIAAVAFDGSNNPLVQPISSGVGCVAHLTMQAKDGAVIFLSDKGLQAIMRQGVTNLGQPQWIGQKLIDFFANETDKREYIRAVACLNQRRAQYVLALKLDGEVHQFARVSLEQKEGGGLRFSLYEQPNVTALASVQSKDSGVERMVGGTEEGFVVWMDDPRSQQAMLGPDAGVWGQGLIASAAGASTSGIAIQETARVDSVFEGPRGVLARWKDLADVVHEVLLLGADGAVVHFADVADAAPVLNDQIAVGCPGYRWESAWMDMGNPEHRKALVAVNLVFRPEASGTLTATLYADFDDDTALQTQDLDLSQAEHVVVAQGVEGRWFKVVLTAATLAYEVRFELASIVWRVAENDQN